MDDPDRKWAEIDMSNQIDNSWNKDSVIAIKRGPIHFSIKLRSFEKKQLRDEFISSREHRQARRHNREVISVIYSYLLYRLLKLSNCLGASKLKICNDAAPKVAVNNRLTAICRHYGEAPIQESLDAFKFRKKGDPKSAAHGLARKIYRGKGRVREDYLIQQKDLEEIRTIIKKIL